MKIWIEMLLFKNISLPPPLVGHTVPLVIAGLRQEEKPEDKGR
jgi:hypothetical protein